MSDTKERLSGMKKNWITALLAVVVLMVKVSVLLQEAGVFGELLWITNQLTD
jgi:hypothetical protein